MAKRKRFNAWILILLCVALLLVAVIGSGFSLNFSTILDKIKGVDEKTLVSSIDRPSVIFETFVYSPDSKTDYDLFCLKISGLDTTKDYMLDLSHKFDEFDDGCPCSPDGKMSCLYLPLRVNGSLAYYYNENVTNTDDFDYDICNLAIEEYFDDGSGVYEYCYKYNESLYLKDLTSDTVFVLIGRTNDYDLPSIKDHFKHIDLYEIEG